ncbi:unnamed protein product [Gadus morhua 'NCC']
MVRDVFDQVPGFKSVSVVGSDLRKILESGGHRGHSGGHIVTVGVTVGATVGFTVGHSGHSGVTVGSHGGQQWGHSGVSVGVTVGSQWGSLAQGLVVLVHYARHPGGGTAGGSAATPGLRHPAERGGGALVPGEQPTVVYTITDYRNYITEALHRTHSPRTAPQPDATTPHHVENVLPSSEPAGAWGGAPGLMRGGDSPSGLGGRPRPDETTSWRRSGLRTPHHRKWGGATSQEVGGATSQEVGGAASQEVGGAEGVLTKDNFLLATFDPWKGKHSDVASSENDVLLLDESTATPPVPDWTDDLGADAGGLDDEGFLFSSLPAPVSGVDRPEPPAPRPRLGPRGPGGGGLWRLLGGRGGQRPGGLDPPAGLQGGGLLRGPPPPDLEEEAPEEGPDGTTGAPQGPVVITQDLGSDPR